jgi:hypothetical protein
MNIFHPQHTRRPKLMRRCCLDEMCRSRHSTEHPDPTGSQSNMRLRSLFVDLIAACLSLIICLAACELLVRLFAPPWLQQRMAALNASDAVPGEFGSDRGWKVDRRNGEFVSFTPHQRFEVTHSEYRNVAIIDELGGRRTAIGGDSGSPRVVMLGDSFTFGVGVEDMETFVSRIATRVSDFRFINLGVPGTALPQQLEILRKRHGELKAKIYVFFFFLGNDFADMLQLSHPETKSPLKTLLRTANDHFCYHPWLEHSYTMQLICNALPIALSATRPWFQLPHDPVFYVMDQSMIEYQDLAAAALRDQLRALSDMQKSMNFKSLIVAIPDVHQVSEASRRERAELYGVPLSRLEALRPNAILENEVRKAELPLFDATACVAASTREPSTLYYQQDNHFRSRGHEVFADCVMPQIAKLIAKNEPQ